MVGGDLNFAKEQKVVFEVDGVECIEVAGTTASENHYPRNVWLEFKCTAPVDGHALKIKAKSINFCGLKVFGTQAGSTASTLPKNGVSIDVDSHGNPTVVTSKDEIYQFKDNAWSKLPQSGSDAAIGPDGKLWKLDSDSSNLLEYNTSGQTWITKAPVP